MDVDDTLVLILERIDSLASLIRAASTCRRWRHIIADVGFLRRFRSLHGAPIAGSYYTGYDPTRGAWFVPSSSIGARHFSLDFIVDKNIIPPRGIDNTPSWDVLDSRGSLVLIKCIHETHIRGVFPDLVVCEPLRQHYKIIPQPPDFDSAKYFIYYGPYLVDGVKDAAGGRIGISNFRVLCLLFGRDDHVAYTTVFTAMDSTWSEKAIDHTASRLCPRVKLRSLGHVLGSCYFYVDGTLITRNGSTGKFSSSILSQTKKSCWDRHIWTADEFCVVDGGDGEPRFIAMTDQTMEVFGKVDGEWTLENKILLSKVTCDLPGYPLSSNGYLAIMKRRVGFVVISSFDLDQTLLH